MDVVGIQKRLNAAEALWQKRRQTMYRLDIQQQGAWINADFQLNVRNKAEAWVFVYPKRLPGMAALPLAPPPTPRLAQSLTVPGLFAQLQAVLNAYQARRSCGLLRVAFDAEDGHIRFLHHDGPPIDDEFTFTVSPLLSLP